MKNVVNRFSDASLTKKASLNAFASAVDYGARVVVEFAINPLLVAGLGNYLYGLWRILWRLNGYIEVAGGRSAQALKWAVAREQTSKDYTKKRRYTGGAVAVWLLSLPLSVMLGVLLVWFIPPLLDVPIEFLFSVRLTIGILVSSVIVHGLAAIPQAVLQGENLGYKRMGLSALVVFMGGVLTALALHFKLGIIGVAAATVCTTLLNGALFLQVVLKHVPWFGLIKPSGETVRWFFGLSGWFLVWKFVMQSMMAGDVIVLGVFDSVELVTTYSLTKFLPETLIRLVAIVVFGISPGLGGIIGAGGFQKAVQVRNEIMSFSWLFLVVAGSTILLWNRTFIQLWVGPAYYAGPVATLLIIVMVAQITLIRNDANIIDLTLNVRTKVLIGVLSEMLSFVLAALLVVHLKMGVTGMCLGYVAGRSIESLAFPWLVGRALGISFYAQIKSMLRPAVASLLVFVPILSCLDFLLCANTVWMLLLGVPTTLIAVSIVAFYTGLSRHQRNVLLQRLRAATRPKKNT